MQWITVKMMKTSLLRKALKVRANFLNQNRCPEQRALRSCSNSTQASVYVHWPYCQKRCTYCNFNKYISNNVNHDEMVSCLTTELRTVLKQTGVSEITSVFFGGGTPNLMKSSGVESLLQVLRPLTSSDLEVTLECNPQIGAEQSLREFRSAGITRISVGLQSLNDADLRLLGRTHTASEAIRFVEASEKLFPGKTSVDVIYGRPGQTLEQWTQELSRILKLKTSHLSLYELTVERGTRLFKDVESGKTSLPSRDVASDMYILALEVLENAGLYRYEVSNFAVQGHECKHNQRYWKGLQYIGIGPGAHSRLDFGPCREARIQTLEPDPWMREVRTRGHGTRLVRHQSSSDRLEEMLMLGMRTTRGLLNEDWIRISGMRSLLDTFGGSPVVEEYINNGFLELTSRHLRATHLGMNVADTITCSLLPLIKECQM